MGKDNFKDKNFNNTNTVLDEVKITETWISVTEKLPRDTDWYKVKTSDGKTKRSFFIRDIHNGTSWERLGKKDVVTHWMAE